MIAYQVINKFMIFYVSIYDIRNQRYYDIENSLYQRYLQSYCNVMNEHVQYHTMTYMTSEGTVMPISEKNSLFDIILEKIYEVMDL